MNKNFRWPIRVYYEDTDSGGVVYYANYLKFFERARTEWLRSLGFEQDTLRDREGVIFAVRSVQAEYLKPARFNQSLSISADIVTVRRASLVFNQKVFLSDKNDEVLCQGEIRIACVGEQSMRPCGIPDRLLKHLRNDS